MDVFPFHAAKVHLIPTAHPLLSAQYFGSHNKAFLLHQQQT